MNKLQLDTKYCLLTAVKVLEEIPKDEGRDVYRVEVEVLPLADHELSDQRIELLLANRLRKRGEVLMHEKPDRYLQKLFSFDDSQGESMLILVITGVLL